MFRTSRGERVSAEQASAGSGSGQPRPYPAAAPPWGPASQGPGSATGPVNGPVGDDPRGPAAGGAKPRKHTLAGSVYAGLAAFLIVLIVVLVLILQNLKEVKVHLFWADFSVPIGILVLLGFIAGALTVLLISLFLHFRQLHRARQQRAGQGPSPEQAGGAATLA
jgi:uncharacterized integral membrane protein